MYAILKTVGTEATHPIKMVDWRTKKTWTDYDAEPGTPIPPHQPARREFKLDPVKLAKARQDTIAVRRMLGLTDDGFRKPLPPVFKNK